MEHHPPLTLTALLLRLKQFHPRAQAELATMTRLMEKHGITDEVFAQELQVDAMTRRLLGNRTP